MFNSAAERFKSLLQLLHVLDVLKWIQKKYNLLYYIALLNHLHNEWSFLSVWLVFCLSAGLQKIKPSGPHIFKPGYSVQHGPRRNPLHFRFDPNHLIFFVLWKQLGGGVSISVLSESHVLALLGVQIQAISLVRHSESLHCCSTVDLLIISSSVFQFEVKLFDL